MKKSQSTRTDKSTENNPIYKVTNLNSYKSEIEKIIEAHYCYRTHVDYWGKLFTAGALRPELKVDYSGVLAEMFCLPDIQKEISRILEKNTPTYETLYSSCKLTFNEIAQYLKTHKHDSKITITHNIFRDLLRPACSVEGIQDGLMFCDLFKVKASELGGTHSFERNYASSSSQLESICDLIVKTFGWHSDWKEKEDLWHCIMDIRDICPHTSKNIDKELDEYLIFISKLIDTLKPYQPSLKVA